VFPEMVTSPSISVTLMICVWSVESLVCWTILLDTLAIASVVAEVIFFETADPMFFILCLILCRFLRPYRSQSADRDISDLKKGKKERR
jgi:hypothetical protein